jgi:hypothetical protein
MTPREFERLAEKLAEAEDALIDLQRGFSGFSDREVVRLVGLALRHVIAAHALAQLMLDGQREVRP